MQEQLLFEGRKGKEPPEDAQQQKRRKAMALILARENAYRTYLRHEDVFAQKLGEQAASEIGCALYRHKKPPYEKEMKRIIREEHLSEQEFASIWNK